MRVAAPHRGLAVGQIRQPLIDQPRQLRVEQRHVDVLAASGDVARPQRGEDRVAGVHPGHHVGDAHAHLHRRAVGLAGHAHDPAHALDHEVVSRAVRRRAVLTETGDRAIDQAGVDRREIGVTEAPPRQIAQLEVLQKNIRPRRQPADHARAFRAGDVHRRRALVAVGAEVIGALARVAALGVLHERRPPAAGVVARTGALDLDHVGAQIAQHLRAGRPGEDAAEVEHAQAGQRAILQAVVHQRLQRISGGSRIAPATLRQQGLSLTRPKSARPSAMASQGGPRLRGRPQPLFSTPSALRGRAGRGCGCTRSACWPAGRRWSSAPRRPAPA